MNVRFDRASFAVSLPGFGDVTDGSVDHYGTDWELSDEIVPEQDKEPNSFSCGGEPVLAHCADNQPEQTDEEAYEIVNE